MTWHRRFFWTLLVFLPTQIGMHFWPDWAHVLGRRVDYLSPTVYLTDILIGLVIFFWFLESFFRISNQESRIRVGAKQKIFSMIRDSRFLILLVVMNVLVAKNGFAATYKWMKVGEFIALGWYIVKTRPALSMVITPLSISVLYSSLLAIAQFILQRSVGGPLWWLGERTFDVSTLGIARFDFDVSLFPFHLPAGKSGFSFFGLRPYATFPHPNVLGGFLAALLPGIIQFSNNPITQLSNKKIYYYLTVFLGTVALFLTFSRSAIVVGIVGIALAIARIKKHELQMLGIGIFVLILASYSMLHNSTDESVVVRMALNDAAIRLWKTEPIFGVGLGNYLVRLPEVLATRTIYFLQPAHNIYLLLLSEIGFVGVGLLAIWVAVRVNYELRIMKYGERKTKSIIHTSLFIILILGLVDHYPATLQQGQLLLTILIAMGYNSVHDLDAMERPLKYRRAGDRKTGWVRNNVPGEHTPRTRVWR